MLVCAESITIGDDVLMSWGVTVVDHDSHSLAWSQRRNDVLDWGQGRKDWTHVPVAPVTIQNKAWIGFGVSILKGVTIGEGAVVAAGSVVSRHVAPWTAVAGSPARKIRDLDPAA
jgi:galactoside O-acetyltransferase